MREPSDYYEFALHAKYPIRDLKNFAWIWDVQDKKLVLYDKVEDVYFGLDKTRMYSLERFLISVNQYLSTKHRK